jgi:hypothetical protein
VLLSTASGAQAEGAQRRDARRGGLGVARAVQPVWRPARFLASAGSAQMPSRARSGPSAGGPLTASSTPGESILAGWRRFPSNARRTAAVQWEATGDSAKDAPHGPDPRDRHKVRRRGGYPRGDKADGRLAARRCDNQDRRCKRPPGHLSLSVSAPVPPFRPARLHHRPLITPPRSPSMAVMASPSPSRS